MVAQVTLTPTQPEPSATPEPLVALVNDEPITMAAFQLSLGDYLDAQEATGTNLATEAEKIVLEDMINQVLLAQGATEADFIIDEIILQERMDQLALQVGGSQVLVDWYTRNGYTEQSFRLFLAQSIAAAWMRDQIAGSVPAEVEQVHARQILLYNSEDAEQVYDLLQSGRDFASLAAIYYPLTAGDIGWFPRGYLTEQAIEEAAFTIEPGEYSEIIETNLGFHIVEVIEKDPQYPLSPDARLKLQLIAVRNWLEMRRSQSDIQVFLP
jgi:peptidyl-prolyl cis-trans isomerase C